jgi:sugar lactone lactonase YvrE
MYYADSPEKVIKCYRYNQEKGIPLYSSDFVKLSEEMESVPDGSIIDSSGNLWNRYFKILSSFKLKF